MVRLVRAISMETVTAIIALLACMFSKGIFLIMAPRRMISPIMGMYMYLSPIMAALMGMILLTGSRVMINHHMPYRYRGKLLRDSLIPKYAQLIYFGFWYSPEMEVLRVLMDKAQEHVSGKVYLKLYKGNVIIRGRESDESLYDEQIASMHVHGGYDQKDAFGFIKLNALRLKASARRLQ